MATAARSSATEEAPLTGAAARHVEKVARIVAQLRASSAFDAGELTEIIDIDPMRRICIAEAGVTFADLVAATLAHGLAPMVVPERSTIGDAVSRGSFESMSFVHGGFHDSCLEYEVITARGDVLSCTPENRYSLVFQMMHGALGRLGILSKLVFRLIPAKPFVRIDYETYTSAEAYRAAIERHAEARDADFMDGIIHDERRYVLSLARFVDHAPYVSGYDWVAVYYQTTAYRDIDYMTARGYFFRYHRGVTNVRPRSLVGRLLLGKVMDSTRWLALARKFPSLRTKRPTATLDVVVPISKLAELLAWFEPTFDCFPMWCVPYRRVHDYEWLRDDYWAGVSDQLFVEIAIDGMKPLTANDRRRIARKLHELGGFDRDERGSIHNRASYDAVKRITDPDDRFRDLYEKTGRAAMGRR